MNYPVPPATSPDFIDYGQQYCNLFFDDFPVVIDGLKYYISISIHFTPGNPAASYGTVSFWYYPPVGNVQVTSESLANLSGTLGPVNGNSNFTATFSGQFNGSLAFNVDFLKYSSGRFRSPIYYMPNSFFTIE